MEIFKTKVIRIMAITRRDRMETDFFIDVILEPFKIGKLFQLFNQHQPII
jgi:hypothetical protein